MQKIPSDKLNSIVIGGAIVSPASKRTALNCEILADRISSMLITETEPQRQNTLRISRTEAQSSFPLPRGNNVSEQQNSDILSPLATDKPNHYKSVYLCIQ